MMQGKTYLGDSVYAQWEGTMLKLTTENGPEDPTNVIYLEPEVYSELVRFWGRRMIGE